jgi:glutamate/aspartate transport system substrate-binding protein
MIAYTLAIAGCAGQAGAQELTGTLKNIKETGAITLGYRESSIPFSYLDDSQKPSATPWTSATRSSMP